MKRRLLFQTMLWLIIGWGFCASSVSARVIDLTFAGRGESTEVETVTVENLTRGGSAELDGKDILRLTSKDATVEENVEDITLVRPKPYPNPAYGEGTLVFDAPCDGEIMVTVADLSGKLMNRASFSVASGRHAVTLPAMPQGMFMICLQGAGLKESFKWMCVGDGSGIGALTISDGSNLSLSTEVVTRSRIGKATTDIEVVKMPFEEGDLLRFTGTCGNMKTIVVNRPTVSHDIMFDFYNCTDAMGYHYAVVRAGDLLWMAEDLRYSGNTLVPLMLNADMWKQYDPTKPMAAYYDFDESNAEQGAYYNLAGAKAAMPEGWQLPTAGEVDYMVQKLGGYDLAGSKLKMRGDDSMWPSAFSDLDSISFGAQPYGYMQPTGTFSGYNIGVRYLTRSTKNRLPLFFELGDAAALTLSKDKPASSLACGFKVRGCRAAPSACSELMRLFQVQDGENAAARAVAGLDGLFANGPLGGNYTYGMERNKMIYTDLNSTDNMPYWYDDGFKGPVTNMSIPRNVLSKLVPQNNSNGRQNTILAYFDNPVDGLDVAGTAGVRICVHGDSTQNYQKLKELTLAGLYTMPPIPLRDEYPDGYLKSVKFTIQYLRLKSEMYAKRFSVACADFTGDGVDELVVALGDYVRVYDGVTFALMGEKKFSSDNVRVTAGDADNDGRNDIALIYPSNVDYCRVEVYRDGTLTAAPPVFANVPAGELNDIKIGKVVGDGRNDVVCYTHSDEIADPGESSGPEGQLRILRCDASVSGGMKTVASTATSGGHNSHDLIPNSSLLLVYDRGSMYPASIAFNQYVARYDADALSFEYFTMDKGWSGSKGEFNLLDNVYVPADNLCAYSIPGSETGEQGILVYRSLGLETYGGSWPDQGQKDTKKYRHYENYDVAFVPVKQVPYHTTLASGQRIIDLTNLYSVTDPFGGTIAWTDCGDLEYAEPMFTCLTTVRSAEPAKVLKFVEWQASMSEPRIYALLAAPPYYKNKPDGTPYDYDYDKGTSWGKSKLSGTGSENSSSHKATVIFGYEYEINAPIVATKLGGIDFEARLGFEWTNSTEKEETITKTNTFTTVDDDGVVLTAYFYDTYVYEVEQSGNPDEIGGKLTISLPAQPRTMLITLTDYERLAGDAPFIPNLRHIFTHTVGMPFTYPDDKSKIKTNVLNTEVLWGGAFEGDEFVGAGSGGTLERSIELDSQTAETSGFTFSMEAELVVQVMAVKAGAGYGYNNSNNSTHTEGEGHAVSATVPGLRSLGEDGLADFRWNICWFAYRLNGQTFPVVYYVVKR